MTQKAVFYGSSDDNVEVEGIKGADEFSGDDMWFLVSGTGGQMRVHVAYNAGGCWSVAVAPADEDIPIPTWPMRFTAKGYTARLEIECPDDAACHKLAAP